MEPVAHVRRLTRRRAALRAGAQMFPHGSEGGEPRLWRHPSDRSRFAELSPSVRGNLEHPGGPGTTAACQWWSSSTVHQDSPSQRASAPSSSATGNRLQGRFGSRGPL